MADLPVPDPLPGESQAEYLGRLQDQMGKNLEAVVAEFEARGERPPEWIAALKGLRDATD